MYYKRKMVLSMNKKINIKTCIIVFIIVAIVIGIGFYMANKGLTDAGRRQEQYKQEMAEKYKNGTSSENDTKNIKDMLPSKNQNVINDDKAKDAAIRAREKTQEAERNQ